MGVKEIPNWKYDYELDVALDEYHNDLHSIVNLILDDLIALKDEGIYKTQDLESVKEGTVPLILANFYIKIIERIKNDPDNYAYGFLNRDIDDELREKTEEKVPFIKVLEKGMFQIISNESIFLKRKNKGKKIKIKNVRYKVSKY